jgi:GT2 family glycosyltransferase
MKMAVLLTCYNRVETTLRGLDRLFAQRLPAGGRLDVFLVDDASPDGTGKRVRERYPQVYVIEGTGNLFWSRGMRLAWQTAAAQDDYDFFLWLNDDVWLADGAVATLLADYEVMRGHHGEGMVVGTFYDGPDSREVFYGCWDERRERVMPAGEPVPFDGEMSGNAVLVGRAVFQKIGVFCEKFRHGLADNDYARLVQAEGFTTCCASAVLGWCAPNRGGDKKQLLGMTVAQRIRVFYSLKGVDLPDYLLYKRRHWGWGGCALSWCKAWTNIVFPRFFAKGGISCRR